MPTNFELKRLKPKLDIVKKPENRVHELTDSISNVSLPAAGGRACVYSKITDYMYTISIAIVQCS